MVRHWASLACSRAAVAAANALMKSALRCSAEGVAGDPSSVSSWTSGSDRRVTTSGSPAIATLVPNAPASAAAVIFRIYPTAPASRQGVKKAQASESAGRQRHRSDQFFVPGNGEAIGHAGHEIADGSHLLNVVFT